MKSIKSIIVDDEQNGRENLKGVLERYCPEVSIVAEANSAQSAVDLIAEYTPDLVFLDIQMPDGNGFKVLDFFQKPNFRVVFVTAYDQYAIQAIQISALDYILKPIDAFKVKEAVLRFTNARLQEDNRLEQFLKNKALTNQNKKIALPFIDKIDFIEVGNIIHCQGEANYTRVYLSDNRNLLVSKSLIEIEEMLSGLEFLRTHKAHIVNKKHVESFIKSDGGYLKMTDGFSVPVSRRKKEFILEELKGQ